LNIPTSERLNVLFGPALKSSAPRIGRRLGESSIACVIARLATRASVVHVTQRRPSMVTTIRAIPVKTAPR